MKRKSRVILSLCFVAFLNFPAEAEVRESKMLKKKFGFELPRSARVSLKLKTKTRVTYMMIEMPNIDAASFKKHLMSLTSARNSRTAIEDSDCKGEWCLKIGGLPISSEPPEAVEKWWQDRDARSDILLTIVNYKTVKEVENGMVRERVKGTAAAVMFFDSRKGFIWLFHNGE